MGDKEKLNTIEIIELMSIYQDEWKHRDNGFYTWGFKFFYATLIVVFLPRLSNTISFNHHNLKIIGIVAPIIGMMMSLCFLYISLCNHNRLYAVGQSYKALNEMLPEKYRRKAAAQFDIIKKGDGKYFMSKNTKLLSFFMFVGMFMIGIAELIENYIEYYL